MNIFINNSVLDSDLSSDAIAAFIAIKALSQADVTIYYVTANRLCCELAGHINATRAYKTKIQSGIHELIKHKIVKLVERSNREFLIDMSEHIIDNNQKQSTFTIVTTDELHKIFKIDTRTDKFLLIRYFASMMSTLNSSLIVDGKKGRIGYVSIEYISKIARTNQQTGCRYNKLLVDNGLIYIHKGLSTYNDSGICRASSNHYGRACDAALIENYLTEQITNNTRLPSEDDLPF